MGEPPGGVQGQHPCFHGIMLAKAQKEGAGMGRREEAQLPPGPVPVPARVELKAEGCQGTEVCAAGTEPRGPCLPSGSVKPREPHGCQRVGVTKPYGNHTVS